MFTIQAERYRPFLDGTPPALVTPPFAIDLALLVTSTST
jgi:hypothetical protein